MSCDISVKGTSVSLLNHRNELSNSNVIRIKYFHQKIFGKQDLLGMIQNSHSVHSVIWSSIEKNPVQENNRLIRNARNLKD